MGVRVMGHLMFFSGGLVGMGMSFVALAPDKWIIGAMMIVAGMAVGVECELRKAQAK